MYFAAVVLASWGIESASVRVVSRTTHQRPASCRIMIRRSGIHERKVVGAAVGKAEQQPVSFPVDDVCELVLGRKGSLCGNLGEAVVVENVVHNVYEGNRWSSVMQVEWAEFSPGVLRSLAPAGTWRARAVEPIGGREKQPDIDRGAGSPRENLS